ncbi:MAG: phosphoribosylformylglycinamidine synthase, partial [Longicatena sp.]
MNYRVFVKKKEAYQVESDSLFHELKQNLSLHSLEGVELYNTYDIFHGDDRDLKLLNEKVLSEKVTDVVYDSIDLSGKTFIAYECLPGQYDQRADSAQQCLMLLNNKQDVVIKSGRIVVLNGALTQQDVDAVKKYLINPVENREKDLNVLGYEEDVEIEAVPVLKGFCELDDAGLEALRSEQGLAMTLADVLHIQAYFRDEEHRDLTLTELKVLDTYWSDHCRHTTFETILQNVKFDAGSLQDTMQKAFDTYLNLREEVHGGKKVMTLMDMATIAGKYLRKKGKLDDMEVSDE